MKVQLTYVFETKDGFRYERETPEEIKEIVVQNYIALKNIVKDGDPLSMIKDYTNEYMPKATISCCINGTWKYYDLRTEVKPIENLAL